MMSGAGGSNNDFKFKFFSNYSSIFSDLFPRYAPATMVVCSCWGEFPFPSDYLWLRFGLLLWKKSKEFWIFNIWRAWRQDRDSSHHFVGPAPNGVLVARVFFSFCLEGVTWTTFDWFDTEFVFFGYQMKLETRWNWFLMKLNAESWIRSSDLTSERWLSS